MIRTGRSFLLYKHLFSLAVGVISGILIAVFSGSGDIAELYISMIYNSDFITLSFYFFVPMLTVGTICFLNGFSLLCGFVRYVISFLAGLGMSNIATLLIIRQGGALAYSLCIYIPTSFIYVFITLLSVKSAEVMWNKIYNCVFSEEYLPNRERLFKKYVVSYLGLIAASAVCAIIITVINKLFFGFFKIVL